MTSYQLFLCVGFVNAQYRFMMKPSGDYTVHFADPDMCVRSLLCCFDTPLNIYLCLS